MNQSFYYDNAESLDKIRQDMAFLDSVKNPLKNPYSIAASVAATEDDVMTRGEREAYLIGNYAKRGYVPSAEGYQAYEIFRKQTEPSAWGTIWEAGKHAASTVMGGAYDMVTSGDILNPLTVGGTVAEGGARGTRQFVNMIDQVKYDPTNPVHRVLFNQGDAEQRYADFQKGLAFQRETGEIEEKGYWVPKKDWDLEGWKIKSFNEQGVAATEMIIDPSIIMPQLKIGALFKGTMVGRAITEAAAHAAVKGSKLAEKAAMVIESGAGKVAGTSMGIFEYPARKATEMLGIETLTTSNGKVIAKDSIIRSSTMGLAGTAYLAQIPYVSAVAGVWLGAKVTEIVGKTAAEALSHSRMPSYLSIADRLAYQSTDPAVRAIGGVAMRSNGFTDWATQGVKSTFHGSMYGGAFGFALGGEEGFYSGVGTGIGLAGSFHMLGGAYGIVGNRKERQIENAQKHFAYVAEGFDEAKRHGVNTLLKNIEEVYGQEKMFRTMANIAATERFNKNGRNLILTTDQIQNLLGNSPDWAEYQKLMKDPKFGGYTTRRSDTGEIVTLINADYAAHSAVTGELFHSALLQRYGQGMKEHLTKSLLGTADSDGFLYKLSLESRVKMLEDFKRAYLELDDTAGGGAQRSMLENFDDAILRVKRGEKPETLYPIFEEFAEAYFNRWVEDKPIDYLLRGSSPWEAVLDGAKKMVRGLINGDVEQIGGRIQFKSGEPEGFFLDGNGQRVVIPEMDKVMRLLVREMKADPDALEGFPIRDNVNPNHILLKDAEHLFTKNESGKVVRKTEEELERDWTKGITGLMNAHAKLKPSEKGLKFTEKKIVESEDTEGSFAPRSKAAQLEAEAKRLEKITKQRQAKLLKEAATAAKASKKEQDKLAREREWDIDVEDLRVRSEQEGVVEYVIEGYMTDAEIQLFAEHLPKAVVNRMAAFNRVIHSKGADGNNLLRFDYDGETEQKFSYTKEGRPTGEGNNKIGGRPKTRDIIPYEMILKFERKRLTKKLREEYGIDDEDAMYAAIKPVLLVRGMDMKALDRRVRYAYNHMRKHQTTSSISSATVKQYYDSEEEIHHDIKRLLGNYSLGDVAMAGADFFGGGSVGRAKRDIINAIIGARPASEGPAAMQKKGYHYPLDLQRPMTKAGGGPLNEAFMIYTQFRVDRVLDKPKHLHGEGFYYNHEHSHPLNKGNFQPVSKALRDHSGRELSYSERQLQDETTFKSPSGEPYRVYASNNEGGVHYAWFDETRARDNHTELTEGYVNLRGNEVLDLLNNGKIDSVKELSKEFMARVADMGYKAVVARTNDGDRVIAFTDFNNFKQTGISAFDTIMGNFAPVSKSIAELTRLRLGLSGVTPETSEATKPMTLAQMTQARLGQPPTAPIGRKATYEQEGMSRAVQYFQRFPAAAAEFGVAFLEKTKSTEPDILSMVKNLKEMPPESRAIFDRTLNAMAAEFKAIRKEQGTIRMNLNRASTKAGELLNSTRDELMKGGKTFEEAKKNPRYIKARAAFDEAFKAHSDLDLKKAEDIVYYKYSALVPDNAPEPEVAQVASKEPIKIDVATDIVIGSERTLSPEQTAKIESSLKTRKALLATRGLQGEIRKEIVTKREQMAKDLAKTKEFRGWKAAEIYDSMYTSIWGADSQISITKGGKVSLGVIQSLSPSEYMAYRKSGVLPSDIKQRTIADIDMALMENWKRRHLLQQSLARLRADTKIKDAGLKVKEAKYSIELESIRNELIQMLTSYKMFDVADDVLGADKGKKTEFRTYETTASSPESAGWTPARAISPTHTKDAFDKSLDIHLSYRMLVGLHDQLGRTEPITVEDIRASQKTEGGQSLDEIRKQMTPNAFKHVIEEFNKYNLEDHKKWLVGKQKDLAQYTAEKTKLDEQIKAAESRSKKYDTTAERLRSAEMAAKIRDLERLKDPILKDWQDSESFEQTIHEILTLDEAERPALIEEYKKQLNKAGREDEISLFEEHLRQAGILPPENLKQKVTRKVEVNDETTRVVGGESENYRDAMHEAFQVLQESIKKDKTITPLQRFVVLMQSVARNYKKNGQNPAMKERLKALEATFKDTEQLTDFNLKRAYKKMLDYGFVSMNWAGTDARTVLDATGHYVERVSPPKKTLGMDFDKLKMPKGWTVKRERFVLSSTDGVKVSNHEMAKALKEMRIRFKDSLADQTDDQIIELAKTGGKGLLLQETPDKQTDLYLTGEARTIRRWAAFEERKDNTFEETDSRIVYVEKVPKYILAKGNKSSEVMVIPFKETTYDAKRKTYYWSRDKGVNESTKARTYSNLDHWLETEGVQFKAVRQLTIGDEAARYAAYKPNGWHLNGALFKTQAEAKRLAVIDAEEHHAYEAIYKTAKRLDKDAYATVLQMIQTSTGIMYKDAIQEAIGYKGTRKKWIDNPDYNPDKPWDATFNPRKIQVEEEYRGSIVAPEFKQLAIYRAGNLLLVTSDNRKDVLSRLTADAKVPVKGGRTKNIEGIAREAIGQYTSGKKVLGDLYRITKDESGQMTGMEWVTHYDSPRQVSEIYAKMNDREFIDLDTSIDFQRRLTKEMKGLLTTVHKEEKKKIFKVLTENPKKIRELIAKIRETEVAKDAEVESAGIFFNKEASRSARTQFLERQIDKVYRDTEGISLEIEKKLHYLAVAGGGLTARGTIERLLGEGKYFADEATLRKAQEDYILDQDTRLNVKYPELDSAGFKQKVEQTLGEIDEVFPEFNRKNKMLGLLEDVRDGDYGPEHEALYKQLGFLRAQLVAAKGGNQKVLAGLNQFKISEKGGRGQWIGPKEQANMEKQVEKLAEQFPLKAEDVALGQVERLVEGTEGLTQRKEVSTFPKYLPEQGEAFVSSRDYMERFKLLVADIVEAHKKFGDTASLDKLDLKKILETDADLLPVNPADSPISRTDSLEAMKNNIRNIEEYFDRTNQPQEGKDFKYAVDMWAEAFRQSIIAVSENRIRAAVMAGLDASGGTDHVVVANRMNLKLNNDYEKVFKARAAVIDSTHAKLPEELKPLYEQYAIKAKGDLDVLRASELERVASEIATIIEVAGEYALVEGEGKIGQALVKWKEFGIKGDPFAKIKDNADAARVYPSIFAEFYPQAHDYTTATRYTKWESKASDEAITTETTRTGARTGMNVGGFTSTNPVVAEVVRNEKTRDKFLAYRGLREIDLFSAALAKKNSIESQMARAGKDSPIPIDAEGYALLQTYFPDIIEQIPFDIKQEAGYGDSLAKAGMAKEARERKLTSLVSINGNMIDKAYTLFLGELTMNQSVIEHAIAVTSGKERLAELTLAENLTASGKIDFKKLKVEELDMAFNILGKVEVPREGRAMSVSELVDNPLYLSTMLLAYSDNNKKSLQSIFGDDHQKAATFLSLKGAEKRKMINEIIAQIQETEVKIKQDKQKTYEDSITTEYKVKELQKISKEKLEAAKTLLLELAQTDVAVKAFKGQVEQFWESRPQARTNILSIDDSLKLLSPNMEYGNVVIGADGKTLDVPVANPSDAMFRTANGMFHAFKQGGSYKLFFAGYKSSDGLVNLSPSHIMTAPDVQRLQVAVRMFHDDVKRIETMATASKSNVEIKPSEIPSFSRSFLDTHASQLSPELIKALEANLSAIGNYPDTTWLVTPESGKKRQIVIYPNSATWDRLHNSGEYIFSKGSWYKDPKVKAAQERLNRARLESEQEVISAPTVAETKPSQILAGSAKHTGHDQPTANSPRETGIDNKTTMEVIEEGGIMSGSSDEPAMQDWTAIRNREGWVILREQNRTAKGWRTKFKTFFPSGVMAGIDESEEDAVARMFP